MTSSSLSDGLMKLIASRLMMKFDQTNVSLPNIRRKILQVAMKLITIKKSEFAYNRFPGISLTRSYCNINVHQPTSSSSTRSGNP